MSIRSFATSSLGGVAGCVLAVLVLAAGATQAHAARAAKPKAATVVLTQLTARGQQLTVRGRVGLPRDTAAQRRRTRVSFTLKGAKGRSERFTAAIDAKRAFRVTRTTKLTGRLSLTARVVIGGRQNGKATSRAVTVRAAARTTPPQGAGTEVPPPTTGPAPPGPVQPSSGTPLVGLFKLDPGAQSVSGALSGTWFQMVQPDGATILANGDSTARDKRYTLLAPGSAGGLRTDAFQEPSDPAFDHAGPGAAHSLSAAIVRPQKFFAVDFSIVTAPIDPQSTQPDVSTGSPPAPVADPLPVIVNRDGALSGQLTAWTAGWNGNWFNQGTPKPDGTRPGFTTPLSGTYDAASGRYVLEWTSLIRGGAFNGFVGAWHLEGTFVPAAR